MTLIITHPGQAHRDEFIAACIAARLAFESTGKYPKILRRDPTQDELDDHNVWVLDVGGKYDPTKKNFDHHHFDGSHPATCSLSLVLRCIGLYDAACNASHWVEFTEVLDSKGPIAASNLVGLNPDNLYKVLSPIEAQFLRLFFSGYEAVPETVVWMMADMGKGWMEYWRKFDDRLHQLLAYDGIRIDGDVITIEHTEDSHLAVERFIEILGLSISVVISKDDRGPGMTLYRRNDDPSIDFNQIANEPHVTFAHKNGFIAKTVAGLTHDHLKWLVSRARVLPKDWAIGL